LDIVTKLEGAIKKAVESPDFTKVMEQLENEALYRDSRTFTRLFHELYPTVRKMVEEAGLLYQPGK
jgi:tripartite-type tricarboxylate transporter receptor subunit TctC